jgi:uncharacterized protein (TIGR02594 family)
MAVIKTVLPTDPPQLKAAFRVLGLTEVRGAVDEPRIVQMFADVGEGWVKDDETSWCGAAIGSWTRSAGLPLPKGPLAARNWLVWGKGTKTPVRGDVVVFSRGTSWQGHVAFYLGEEGGRVYHIGGNQSDRVSVTSTPRSKVLGFRTARMAGAQTLIGQSLTGAGVVSVGAGEAGTNHELVADQVGQAGYVLQALGSVSEWLYLLGAGLVMVGIGWTLYATVKRMRGQ